MAKRNDKKIDFIDENTWWLSFFKNIGQLKWNDSIELADYLRCEGLTPEETAHKVNLYDQDLY